ncbi:MAG: DUF255 domain-containing protein [Planctomycetota bacterium]|jgi:uncharacterized protein YyaL (SSP411 family)
MPRPPIPPPSLAAGVLLAASALAACDGGANAPSSAPVAVEPVEAPPAAPVPPAGDPDAMAVPDAEPAAASVDYEGRNRLGGETSPYLLQHQHNPVHWFPWGPEAFETARRLDRPIFLSVGYSTCYWCHVMERESFENEAIARLMNDRFICIKVDREERPDVDDIYMAAVQILTRSGGWPMSVFIEPTSLKPFLGGTYYPPEDRFGRPGFPTVLSQVHDFWTNQRPQVLEQADRVAGAVVQQLSLAAEPVPVDRRTVERGVSVMLSSYDRTDAGFGGAPKFPMPSNLAFLMAAGWDLGPVRDAVKHTLDRMATGGMYDQVGGGFHRYSTDAKWLVPHFEKMLYDNGQLASVYAEAYVRTRDPFHAEIVRETLDYVLREMTDAGGAFLSAQDAEVNHKEGDNYLWTAEEIRAGLTDAGREDLVEFALQVYGLDQGTNFRDPHHAETPPRNVLYLPERPDTLAKRMDLELDAFEERVAALNAALYDIRARRDQPGTDDKVLAAWNGLMIAGFADGGRILQAPAYVDAGARAADFILGTMRGPDGGLLRTYRAGEAKIDAFLEDYAFLIRGLLALHRASGETRFLDEARSLADLARARFRDDDAGGYFDTLAGQSDLFVRTKSTYDGAVPCGASVMIHNLLDLHEATGEEAYLDDATRTLESFSAVLASRPQASMVAMAALQRFIETHPDRIDQPLVVAPGSTDVVVVGASTKAVELAPGESARVELTIQIARGFHINAHRPGPEFLVPLKIELTGGTGVALEVDYPRGDSYHSADIADGEILVHESKVTVPVTIRATGRVGGRPSITVTYQACTDKICHMPKTDVLALRIAGK